MADRIGASVTRATQGALAIASGPEVLCIALLAQRGPINQPMPFRSLGAFRQMFGEEVTFADGTRHSVGRLLLEIWFKKRGSLVYVMRIAGSGAAIAEVSLNDVGVAPEPTLKIKAKGPGAAYDTLVSGEIQAGTRANTRKLIVRCTGFDTETFDNITMTDESLASIKSAYVDVVNLNSGNDAPENLPVIGAWALAGGADDNAPDAATIVGTDNLGVKTGLSAFRTRQIPRGAILAPDLDGDPTVKSELEAQGERYFRLVLANADAGSTPASAVTQRQAWSSPMTAFYYPRAVKTDPYSGEARKVPITVHMFADYLNVREVKGPGKAPAGQDFKIDFVQGLETQANGQQLVDEDTNTYLNANRVNAAYARIPGQNRIWGARTCSLESGWTYLHGSMLWCQIGDDLQRELDKLTFENASDPLFLESVYDGAYNYMANLHELNAFRGELPPPGATPDEEKHAFAILIETDSVTATVRVKIWFKDAITGETIAIELAKNTTP